MQKLKLVKTSKELALQSHKKPGDDSGDESVPKSHLHISEPPSIVATEAGNLQLVVPHESHNHLIVSEPASRPNPKNPVRILDEDEYVSRLRSIVSSGGDVTAFQQTHTTEDSASFQQLVQRDNAIRESNTSQNFPDNQLEKDWEHNPRSALFFRPKDIPQETSCRGEIAAENTVVVQEAVDVERPGKTSSDMADAIITAVKGPHVDGYSFITKNAYSIAPESRESQLLKKLTTKKSVRKVPGERTPRGDLSPAGRNLLNKISKKKK